MTRVIEFGWLIESQESLRSIGDVADDSFLSQLMFHVIESVMITD